MRSVIAESVTSGIFANLSAGTRMVISNKADFPGAIFHGKEYKHPRPAAGILFFNDEGTEDGGLVYGGARDKNGKVSNHGHLSFDNFDQDQTLVLESNQDDTDRSRISSSWRRRIANCRRTSRRLRSRRSSSHTRKLRRAWCSGDSRTNPRTWN